MNSGLEPHSLTLNVRSYKFVSTDQTVCRCHKWSAQKTFSDLHPLVEEAQSPVVLDHDGIAETTTVASPSDPLFTDVPGEATPAIPDQRFRWPSHFPDDTPTAFAEKQYFIHSFSWTTTMTHIVKIPIVAALLSQINARVPLSAYKAYTYDNVEVSVTLRGGQYYKGRLGISYLGKPFSNDAEKNIYGLSQFPTAHLDPTLDTEKTMKCSRVSPYPKEYSTSGGPCILVYPIVPLGSDAIATPSSLTVEVYAHFNGLRLLNHVSSGGLSISDAAVTNVVLDLFKPNVFQGPGEESVKKSEGGVISKTLESVSGIAGALSVLPVVGSTAGVISTIAGVGSAIASAFGFSRPAIVSTPEIAVTRQIPYANAFGGVATGEPLSCEFDSTMSTDPKLVGDLGDHTNIYKIAAVPSLIRVDRIQNINTIGSKVVEFGVTPCTSAGIDSLVQNNTLPSNIGYVSALFKLWTGDIKYTFDFVSTLNQAVKVAIVWSPNKTNTWNAQLRQQQVFIQGSLKVAFDVPWENINASQLCGISSGRNNPVDNGSYSNGYISIWVLQPITSGLSTTPTDIQFLTYQSAGESFRLIGPRGLGSGFSYQNAVGATSLTVPQGIYSEEKVGSLRELAKKYCYTTGVQVDASTGNFNLAFNMANFPRYHQYIIRKFTYFRGDVSLRLYDNFAPTPPCPTYLTDGGTNDSYRLYLNPKTHSEAEITLRFLARSGFRETHSIDGSHNVYFTSASLDPALGTNWDVYFALDDTLSLGIVRCSPLDRKSVV